jgi:DNA-binding NtrC family response regulator
VKCVRWARAAPRHVDVRLIAATHRDLRTAMAEGRFREDLYYRLRRVVLTVPPLRARLNDLPLLVEHVCRQVNARHGLGIEGVKEGAIARLAGYPWPGNVRELEAVLEEAMLLRGRGLLRVEDVAVPHMGPTPSAETIGHATTRRGARARQVWSSSLPAR